MTSGVLPIQPWPVNSPSAPADATLHFRGQRNLLATLEYALKNHGFASATELVVTGGSAGT
jgi:hypothetical protein